MGRIQLKIKNWPFEKGKKVQLIWIGEPFRDNNKWMIDTYFNDEKITKKVIQDWANIHFLSIDKYYIDGDLNSGKIIDKHGIMEIMDVDLNNVIPKYNENDWRIKCSSYKSKSRTFNFYKNKILYSIPVVEIVRSVLAPNTFMLNSILYSDIFEDYFTYEINNRILNLYFNNNYKSSYLKDNYYNHLAWIIGNKEILNMVNSIGYNTSIKYKIMFDFSIPKFKFTARVKKNKSGYTVLEIVKVKEKEINFNEIRVFHPSFEKNECSDKTKKWSYVSLNDDSERIIDNNLDGTTKLDESIKGEFMIHEYVNIPVVKKEKIEHVNKRGKEDENTKKYIRKADKSRSLADEGGVMRAKGIEVVNKENINYNAQLNNFIEILNIISQFNKIKRVDTDIAYLPLGKRFSYLNSNLERRKCILAKITMNNNEQIGMIEIERESKSISMLCIKLKERLEWKFVCNILLVDLVKENGTWKTENIEKVIKLGMGVVKIRHTSHTNKGHADKIYKKILDLI